MNMRLYTRILLKNKLRDACTYVGIVLFFLRQILYWVCVGLKVRVMLSHRVHWKWDRRKVGKTICFWRDCCGKRGEGGNQGRCRGRGRGWRCCGRVEILWVKTWHGLLAGLAGVEVSHGLLANLTGVQIWKIVHWGGRGHRPVGRRGREQGALLVEAGWDRGGGREQPVKLGVAVGRRVVGEQGRVVRGVLVRAVGALRLARCHQGVEVELVCVTLAVHFGHDVLIVVISQGAAHLVVVHVGFWFSLAPLPGHLVRVSQLELPAGPLPGDDVGVSGVGEELKQELPELDLSTALGHQAAGGVAEHRVRIWIK